MSVHVAINGFGRVGRYLVRACLDNDAIDIVAINSRAKLPKRYWTDYNTLLVAFGQSICHPVSPFCSRCTLAAFCDRVGVARSR